MCDSILYDCFVFCRLAEKKTDDILDNPNKSDGKQSQEEVDETVTKRKFFVFNNNVELVFVTEVASKIGFSID